ncbi:hypothetical protein [Litoribrevibacter albus]|nr:hypothetical protein [Litoribrevibacter albus]
MTPKHIRFLFSFLPLFFFPNPYIYADLSNPTDDIIVEVSGAITVTNADDMAIIDRDVINNLPRKSITTSSHITEVPVTYSGPLFTDLLTLLGSKGRTVVVIAWDDYLAEISVDDLDKYGVILADSENGKQLTLSDRGPLYVVFPFSDFPEIRNDLYYNKSVWQIKAIEVK